MNKIIRRLAIVAVAAVIWTGPGLAWGAWINTANPSFDLTKLDAAIDPSVGLGTSPAQFTGDVKANLGTGAFLFEATFGSLGTITQSISTPPVLSVFATDLNVGTFNPAGLAFGWGMKVSPVQLAAGGWTINLVLKDAGNNVLDSVSLAGVSQSVFIGSYWDALSLGTAVAMVELSLTGTPMGMVPNDPMFQVDDFRASSVQGSNPQPPAPGRVPEPTTLAIWSLLSLIGLAVVRRRRRV